MFLELEGYQVESFSNAKDALVRLRSAPEPDLILLDLLMPVMTGEDFMVEFKKLTFSVDSIPVCMISASGSAEDAKKMGCSRFLKKPIDLGVLLLFIHEVCNSKKNL